MKTCADCLSFERCLELGEVVVNVHGGDHICRHFKSKNGYTKLGCEVGDTVYKIIDWPCREHCEGCPHFKASDMDDILSECRRNLNREDERHPDCLTIKEETNVSLDRIIGFMSSHMFGKDVFTTREAAERQIERLKRYYREL